MMAYICIALYNLATMGHGGDRFWALKMLILIFFGRNH